MLWQSVSKCFFQKVVVGLNCHCCIDSPHVLNHPPWDHPLRSTFQLWKPFWVSESYMCSISLEQGKKGWPEGTTWAFKMEKQDGQASAEPPSFPTAAQFSHTLSFNSKGGYKVPDTCPFPEGIIQEHWCRLREPEKTRMRKKLTPELGRKNFCREVDRIHT